MFTICLDICFQFMLIKLKNKDQLMLDDFTFKCAIGKNQIKSKKKEGDKSTPMGTYKLSKLYYRKDKVKPPLVKIKTKIIKLNKNYKTKHGLVQ